MLWLINLGFAAGGVLPSTPDSSGGFFHEYERYSSGRARRKREREDALEAAREIVDDIDREIAVLIHEDHARDLETEDLERLHTLVQRFADEAVLNERVERAYARAAEQATAASLLALEREVNRMLEEEELAALMILLN